jgi:hypothetical protein
MEPVNLNIPYKTKGNIQEGDDPAILYDCNTIHGDDFTTAQLLSIQLADIITEYKVPREAYRKLVNLMNTVIRDHDKIMEGKNRFYKVLTTNYSEHASSFIL